VQATLGHSSVATTSRYLHARPGDSSARFLTLSKLSSDSSGIHLLVPGTGVMNVLTAASTAPGENIMKTKKNAEQTATPETSAVIAEQSAHVAAAKVPSKKGATRKHVAHKSQKNAKTAAAKKTAKGAKGAKQTAKHDRTKEAGAPRAESKGGKILAMVGRTGGATLAEIMTATGWQAHSVRGFLSNAGKKQGD
jgi:hypothetical protein